VIFNDYLTFFARRCISDTDLWSSLVAHRCVLWKCSRSDSEAVRYKLSCRWHITWCLCTPMLRSRWHKTLWSTTFHAMQSRVALLRMTAIYLPDCSNFACPSPIWRRQWEGSSRLIGFIYGMGKLEWLGYNLVKVAWWSTQLSRHNAPTWHTVWQTATSP